MDLTGMIQNPVEDQNSEQKLSKEEYAALKKQEREETWMQIDGQAQSVFRDGASLQKFLDFMAGQYNMPKVPNLLLLYSQNPEVKLVKSFDEWKHDRRSLRTGVHGYTYIIDTKYEKDGEMRSGYAISKGYDITQTKGRPLEERPVLAAGDPLAVVNNLSDFIFSLIRAIGLILLGFGVMQIGLSLKSHDPSQRANGFLTLAGGVIITFAKEILDLIMV